MVPSPKSPLSVKNKSFKMAAILNRSKINISFKILASWKTKCQQMPKAAVFHTKRYYFNTNCLKK